MKFPPPFYKALGPSPALDVIEVLSMGRLVKHQSLLSCCLDDKKSPTVKHMDSAGQVEEGGCTIYFSLDTELHLWPHTGDNHNKVAGCLHFKVPNGSSYVGRVMQKYHCITGHENQDFKRVFIQS